MHVQVMHGPSQSASAGERDAAAGIAAAIDACCGELKVTAEHVYCDNTEAFLQVLSVPGTRADALLLNLADLDLDLDQQRALLGLLEKRARPVVEVHKDNVFLPGYTGSGPLRGVGFRLGLISGLGTAGYSMAVHALVSRLPNTTSQAVAGSKSIRVINGPNLNLLGTREPEIYGHDTLADVQCRCEAITGSRHRLTFQQSNHEGQIIDWIQAAIADTDALVLNAGAYTHTSVAIHDALKSFRGTVVELHISNPHMREPFRHTSYVGSAADGAIAGLGVAGYEHAVAYLCALA